MLRTGCPWRFLPDSVPPWRNVYLWFVELRDNGGFERLNHHLVQMDRVRVGREPMPSAAVIDSHSAKTTETGGSRGYDADSAYTSPRVVMATSVGVEILCKFVDQTGFVVHPRRWVVERVFGWLNRNRRLAKDFEQAIRSAKACLYAASATLVIRRLARYA